MSNNCQDCLFYNIKHSAQKARLSVFDSIEQLKERKFVKYNRGECYGYLYVLEFGNYTKIGITKDVITRIMTHSSNARIYADTTIKRIAVTNSFMFFRELESYLHNMFNPFRKDTEMFCVPFEHVVCAVEETLRQPFFNFIYSL